MLLQVRDLKYVYESPGQQATTALNGISFDLKQGEVLAVVGESGSGKSSLAYSILRVLPQNARIVGGAICYRGEDVLKMPEKRLQQIRGARISMVLQQPGIALNPVMRIWRQVAEVIRAHRKWDGSRVRREAKLMLSQFFAPGDLDRICASYPHQLSAGERQRVSIAQALVCGPELLIADEPTASLDSVTQAGILEFFRQLKRLSALSMIFITHTPAILPGLADRVLVLREGHVVEEGQLYPAVVNPEQPYTAALMQTDGR
jgi:ABC-type glutathione transport system ATPase component